MEALSMDPMDGIQELQHHYIPNYCHPWLLDSILRSANGASMHHFSGILAGMTSILLIKMSLLIRTN